MILSQKDYFIIQFADGSYSTMPTCDEKGNLINHITNAIQYESIDAAIDVANAYKGLGFNCKIIPIRITITECNKLE